MTQRRIQLALGLALAVLAVVDAGTVSQCNLGNKLYSIENGGSVCAPLAPYQCVHSCQWNTSCALTTHSIAFQGRRSFVAGMILSPDNFLVLCCATFANVVQQNQRQENRCVWVPPILTIETGPSIRFDPPLSQNEYVRDIAIKRLDRGKVEVRVQICKFMTQRTNCDEGAMPPDDLQLYNMLQLRLSRTEMFLRDNNGTVANGFFRVPGALEEVATPNGDSFRDEVLGGDPDDIQSAQLAQHRLSSQLRNQDQPVIRERPIVQSAVIRGNARAPRANFNETIFNPTTDRFRRFPSDEPGRPVAIDRTVEDLMAPSILKPTYPPMDRLSPAISGSLLNGGSGPQPTSVISRGGNPQTAVDLSAPFRSRNVPSASVPNALTAQKSRPAFVHSRSRLNGVAETRAAKDPREQQETHKPQGQRIHFAEQVPDAVFTFSAAHSEDRIGRVVLSTNQTRETVPRQRPQLPVSAPRAHAQPSFLQEAPAREDVEEQLEEKPIKSSLAIRKIHLGNVRNPPITHATSFGGSFASGEQTQAFPTARNLRTFSNLTPIKPIAHSSGQPPAPRAKELGANFQAARQLFQQPGRESTPQTRVPQPIVPTLFNNSSRRIFKQKVITVPVPQAPPVLTNRQQIVPVPHYREHQLELERQLQAQAQAQLQARAREQAQAQSFAFAQQKEASLRGLLQCCQEQAPGCRHLCTPNVSKDEIRRAIQTNQCPPLSMTSVLQCFPRYYNISSVGQCCGRASGYDEPQQDQAVQSVVGFLTGGAQPQRGGGPRLPGQCQSLCAPNFKLSFSHFACVDHINTIVDCYRDLLAR